MLQVCLNGIRKKEVNSNIPYTEEEIREEIASLRMQVSIVIMFIQKIITE